MNESKKPLLYGSGTCNFSFIQEPDRVPFFKEKSGYWLFLTEHLGPGLDA